MTTAEMNSGSPGLSTKEGSAENPIKVFFSYGFRPFFLLGSIYAVVAMSLFLFWIGIHHAGGDIVKMTITMAPHTWHAHEMLFGFTMAIIAGFFLTAVPNWTGTHAVDGWTLAVVTFSWLAGRFGVGFSAYFAPELVAALDLSLIPILGFLVARAMGRRLSKRNFVFLPILVLLFLANLSFHLEQLAIYEDGSDLSQRLGLGTIILLITIIGGRVVPAFTTNALRNQGVSNLPVNFLPLNLVGIAAVAALLIADWVAPDHIATGWIALFAALTNALRLGQWKGHLTFRQPILWVLHLGFAWLVIGLAVKGISILGVADISKATALHALTAGAIGTMTLAVMSRAALGHTGRPLDVAGATVVAYVLITIGAAGRVLVPLLWPEYYNEGMLLAGVTWIAAFGIFTIAYWPVLTGPRKRKIG